MVVKGAPETPATGRGRVAVAICPSATRSPVYGRPTRRCARSAGLRERDAGHQCRTLPAGLLDPIEERLLTCPELSYMLWTMQDTNEVIPWTC